MSAEGVYSCFYTQSSQGFERVVVYALEQAGEKAEAGESAAPSTAADSAAVLLPTEHKAVEANEGEDGQDSTLAEADRGHTSCFYSQCNQGFQKVVVLRLLPAVVLYVA